MASKLTSKRSTWNNKVSNNEVEHLTSKVSQIRSIGPRSLPIGIIPSLNMEEHTIEEDELDYPEYIEDNKIWTLFGSFIDYALRRIISRLSKDLISDDRCEDVIAHKGKSGTIKYREDIISTISAAYDRYKDPSISTKNTLQDTWIVSLTHSMWFGSLSVDSWDTLCNIRLSPDEEVIWTSRLKSMIRGLGRIIETDTNELEEARVISNPNLSVTGIIRADADLIIGDVIIDFKCSRNDPINTKNFIQILGYATLARRLNICKANSIIILNPLSGKIAIQDISLWDHSRFYEFVFGHK